MRPAEQMASFTLTTEEKESKLWRRLSVFLDQRLELARSRLEGDRDEAETATLRGAIGELRTLIALSTKLPAVDESPR
jgi:hypothetical protein